MRRYVTIVGILLVAIAGASFATGTVLDVEGMVEVRSGGQWIELSSGDPVAADATIATGFRSKAVIQLGSSVITVEPLSQVSLAELSVSGEEERVALDLPFGEIRAEVKPDAPRDTRRGVDFQILSPLSTAAVRGTVFTYDGVELSVDEGRVSLMNAYGQWHSVGAGQHSRAYRWQIASVESTDQEEARGR